MEQQSSVHNPVKPDRSQIVVPTTERKFDGYKDVKKTRRYRDSKGEWKEETTTEREEKYITVRRSQADIDRDIESTFRVLQADYEQKLLLRSELLKAKEFADDRCEGSSIANCCSEDNRTRGKDNCGRS